MPKSVTSPRTPPAAQASAGPLAVDADTQGPEVTFALVLQVHRGEVPPAAAPATPSPAERHWPKLHGAVAVHVPGLSWRDRHQPPDARRWQIRPDDATDWRLELGTPVFAAPCPQTAGTTASQQLAPVVGAMRRQGWAPGPHAGLHVRVGASHLSDDQVLDLMVGYCQVQPFLRRAAAPRLHHAGDAAPIDPAQVAAALVSHEPVATLTEAGGRALCVAGLRGATAQGTVALRLFHGALDGAACGHAVALAAAMVRAAGDARGRPTASELALRPPFAAWAAARGVPPETTAWFAAREVAHVAWREAAWIGAARLNLPAAAFPALEARPEDATVYRAAAGQPDHRGAHRPLGPGSPYRRRLAAAQLALLAEADAEATAAASHGR